MDVLSYSAFNEAAKLDALKIQRDSELVTKTAETAALEAVLPEYSADAICWLQCVEPCLRCSPNLTNYWCFIPKLSSDNGVDGTAEAFKVCSACPQFNCGASCTWTVPAGASKIRFQLWGAGGGSATGCCCGGSPFGATGAYASVIIPATPGCQYTICSGCAYCCFAAVGNGGRMPGCPSYVTGFGLDNFCASGGKGRMGEWMSDMGFKHTYRLAAMCCESAGNCFCNQGADYCMTGCASCGIIEHAPAGDYFGSVTHPDSQAGIVYGIKGIWPRMCWDTNHYGCQWHPPIYGFEDSSCCNPSYTSGNCCGCMCSAARGYLQIPGAGAFYSHAMGGGINLCADMGRMGMVCVQWE